MFPFNKQGFQLFVLLFAVSNIKNVSGNGYSVRGRSTTKLDDFHSLYFRSKHEPNKGYDGTGHSSINFQGVSSHKRMRPEITYGSPEVHSLFDSKLDEPGIINEIFDVMINHPEIPVNLQNLNIFEQNGINNLEPINFAQPADMHLRTHSTDSSDFSHPVEEQSDLSSSSGHEYSSNHPSQQETDSSNDQNHDLNEWYMDDVSLDSHVSVDTILGSELKELVDDTFKAHHLEETELSSDLNHDKNHYVPDQHRAGPSSKALAEQSSPNADLMKKLLKGSGIELNRKRLEEITSRYRYQATELIRQLLTEMIPLKQLKVLHAQRGLTSIPQQIRSAILIYVNHVTGSVKSRTFFSSIIRKYLYKIAKATKEEQVGQKSSQAVQSQSLDVELIKGSGIMVNENKLNAFIMDGQKRPSYLIRKLLKELIPDEDLLIMSVRRRCGFKPIPKKINNAIKDFVERVTGKKIDRSVYLRYIGKFLWDIRRSRESSKA